MKKLLLSAVVLVFIFFALFSFFSSDTEIVNINSTGTTVVAFGNSLVEGVGATTGNNFVDVLSRRLAIDIINEGVSGNTTAAGLARIDDVIAHNPKVVIVLLGGNDAIRKVPQEETFTNLRQIITTIQQAGSAVILVGIQSGLLRDRFDEAFEDLSKELGTGYVPDILNGLIGRSTFMADPIHPNDAGYGVVADRIEPALRELLNGQL